MLNQASPDPVDHKGRTWSTSIWLVLFGLLACVYVAAAAIRGRYLDEFWTLSFADMKVPFRLAFDDWSSDTGHPVGFYAINRYLGALVPGSVFAGRLLNLLYLAAEFLAAWSYDRYHDLNSRRFGLMFSGALASSYFVIERFSQFRATFMALMILAVIVIVVRNILENPRSRFGSGLALVALCTLLGLIEYPVSIAALALCGGLGLIAIGTRNWSQLMVAVASGLACLLVIAASLANSTRFTILALPYWESMPHLAFDLAVVVATALFPCAALVILLVMRGRPAGRTWIQVAVETPFRRCLLLAIFLTLFGIVILDAATHALVRRQLFGIIPLVVAFPVDVAAQHLRLTKRTSLLVLANVLTAALLALIPLRSKLDFDRLGSTLASAQRSCPSLAIYGVLPEPITNLGKDYQMKHTRDSRLVGYDQVAHDYGFRLAPFSKGAPPRIDPECGAIIWSETVWSNKPLTAGLVYDRLGMNSTPDVLARTQFHLVDNSLLMRIPPSRRSTPLR